MCESIFSQHFAFSRFGQNALILTVIPITDIKHPLSRYFSRGALGQVLIRKCINNYSHSVRRESLLVYLVVSRPQKTDATALCGTSRHQTGTALLSCLKLKLNSVVLSFIFVPVRQMPDSSIEGSSQNSVFGQIIEKPLATIPRECIRAKQEQFVKLQVNASSNLHPFSWNKCRWLGSNRL